jgi:hypothetical protein
MQVLANCTGNFTKANASGRQAFPSLGSAYAVNRRGDQVTVGTAIKTAT